MVPGDEVNFAFAWTFGSGLDASGTFAAGKTPFMVH